MNHRFSTKRLSIYYFLIQINASQKPVLTPFIAKIVEGIFGYNILLYGFLFRRQWGSFSQSFARIGLLFIKCRRVEHKATHAHGFLGSAAVYKLRFTLEKQERIYNYIMHLFRYIYI